VALQIRRGTSADVQSESLIPLAGEPIYLTDTNSLYVGDGATQGGNLIGGANELSGLNSVHLSSENISTVQSFSITTNVVQVTTAINHSFGLNDQVTISGASSTILNGTHTITTVPTGAQFTFILTNADVASTVSTGSVSLLIPNNSVLAYDTTNARWEDKEFGDLNITLDKINNIDSFNATLSGHANPDIGKIIRYDYDLSWSVKRPGDPINNSADQGYIGIDFDSGIPGSIYTANSSLWTENANNSTGVLASSVSAIPSLPYGDGAVDGNSLRYTPTNAFTDSQDFTLDFWFYRPTGVSNWDEGMSFLNSGTYTAFQALIAGNELILKSCALYDGTLTNSLYNVIKWEAATLSSSLDDEWIHVAVVREGTDFRAWINGVDKGTGVLQGSYTTAHDFKFSNFAEFMAIGSNFPVENIPVGPLFVDLQKAHYDPSGGNIFVPKDRVDFYNLKSGVKLEECLNVSTYDLTDGDGLTWHQNKWMPGRPVYTKYKFNLTAAPTATVASSERVGSILSLGDWAEVTFANYATNGNIGPASVNEDPNLNITKGGTAIFSGFPKGTYRIDLIAEITLDSLAINSYYSHSVKIECKNFTRDLGSSTSKTLFSTNGTNVPAAPVVQTVEMSNVVNFKDGSSIGNTLEILLDSDQSDQFYVSDAFLTITKIS